MQDCRQWVKSRMEDRGAKPCEFSQTAPPHKPSDSVSNTTFSDLPYVLDNASDSRDTPASLPQKAGPPGNGCLVRCFPIPRRIGYSPITLIARNRHYGPSAPITHSASFPFFSSVFCPRPQRCQKLPQSNRRSPRRCQKLPQSRSFQDIRRR
ncbi:hypothetical protein V6Z11_A12G000700 [Gossypium hirsutum]